MNDAIPSSIPSIPASPGVSGQVRFTDVIALSKERSDVSIIDGIYTRLLVHLSVSFLSILLLIPLEFNKHKYGFSTTHPIHDRRWCR